MPMLIGNQTAHLTRQLANEPRTLIPNGGERIKTNRREARKFARWVADDVRPPTRKKRRSAIRDRARDNAPSALSSPLGQVAAKDNPAATVAVAATRAANSLNSSRTSWRLSGCVQPNLINGIWEEWWAALRASTSAGAKGAASEAAICGAFPNSKTDAITAASWPARAPSL